MIKDHDFCTNLSDEEALKEISKILAWKSGVHDPTILSIFKMLTYEGVEHPRLGQVVVDVGAGIGTFTTKASRQVGPTGFVYAFEPEPENFTLLKRNTEKLKNTRIFQRALWSSSGVKTLYVHPKNWGGHGFYPNKYTEDGIEVHTVTLDEVVKGRVDFLKIDIEGAELEVLKGSERILREYKPFIAVELHTEGLFQQVPEYLLSLGYNLCEEKPTVHMYYFRHTTSLKIKREELVERVHASVPGMVQKVECLWLYEMAQRCSKGVIVEIGSNAGMSTICLALGSKAGNCVKVYAVDPFNGGGASPDPTWWDTGDEGTPDPKYYVNQGVSFQPFWENIKRFQTEDIVRPIVNYSELAVKEYPEKPIELLFVDGDHRYNYVKMDLELWTPFVIPGGVVALHDSTYLGVKRVIDETIMDPKKFENIECGPIFHAIKK